MKNPETDASKAISSKSGSSSFENLFAEHWTRIYRLLCCLVGDPAEAEDLALEAFFRLHQHYPQSDGTFNTGGWLYRVATNLGLHSIRDFKRREHYELTAGRYALDETKQDDPPEALAQEEERQLARSVLASMDERQSQLLIMRHSGMAYKDIAKALGLSPASIGPLLLRAEREFEKRYRALTQEEV
ncbi:MAG: sigma-70 family RNA polymerase sigma factor [Chloroflexota bacterium]